MSDNGQPPTQGATPEPRFGSLTPAEASKKGHEARWGGKRKQAELTDDEQIEAGLVKRAKTGDPNAVRELREWRKVMRATVGLGSLNEDILSLLNDEQLETLEGWVADSPGPNKPEGIPTPLVASVVAVPEE